MTGNLTIFRVIWGKKKQMYDIFYKKNTFLFAYVQFFL